MGRKTEDGLASKATFWWGCKHEEKLDSGGVGVVVLNIYYILTALELEAESYKI